MNYSASDAYHKKCDEFRRKQIAAGKIRRHWFKRNFYVMHRTEGYFTHLAHVFKVGDIDPTKYTSGEYYGPFREKAAHAFAADLVRTHTNFALG